MATQALTKRNERMPSLFDDFFKPWNEWFEGDLWGRTLNVPAVNIAETSKQFMVSVAAPGLKKEDFHIDINGNLLTISSAKEETKEEKDGHTFTRKEYNFSSFSRCFTLPDEVNKEMIEATYTDGVLKIMLPRKEEMKKTAVKQIAVK